MKNRKREKGDQKVFAILVIIGIGIMFWKYALPIIAVVLILGLVLYFTSKHTRAWVNTKLLRRKPKQEPTKPADCTICQTHKKEGTHPFEHTCRPSKSSGAKLPGPGNNKADLSGATTSDLISELTKRGKLY